MVSPTYSDARLLLRLLELDRAEPPADKSGEHNKGVRPKVSYAKVPLDEIIVPDKYLSQPRIMAPAPHDGISRLKKFLDNCPIVGLSS